MLKKTVELIVPFFCVIFVVTQIGCYIDADDDRDLVDVDDDPPAIPRGVRTITGDEYVIIEWYPNGENDLKGYKVWRGEDDINFDLIAEIISSGTEENDREQYKDTDVRNGSTYFYAVTAFDVNGNESELSPEEAWDTPRPEGRNITLDDYQLAPERSGFDFSNAFRGAIAWNDRETDVYFGLELATNITYLYSDNSKTGMQDLGYHENFDAIDVVPEFGYVKRFVEIIEGHIYAIYTPDGNYAKIHVRILTDESVEFDWAYQTEVGNIQLAPAKPKRENSN